MSIEQLEHWDANMDPIAYFSRFEQDDGSFDFIGEMCQPGCNQLIGKTSKAFPEKQQEWTHNTKSLNQQGQS